MKILVMSDTHGRIDRAEKVIRNLKNIDLLLHLGDNYRDAEKLAGMFPGLNVDYVYGNCDYGAEWVQSEKTLVLDGKRIFMTHGHNYSVKSGYGRLRLKAKQSGADLVLFGHTHAAEIVHTPEGTLLNPGSLACSRDEKKESCAVVEITENNMEISFIYI